MIIELLVPADDKLVHNYIGATLVILLALFYFRFFATKLQRKYVLSAKCISHTRHPGSCSSVFRRVVGAKKHSPILFLSMRETAGRQATPFITAYGTVLICTNGTEL